MLGNPIVVCRDRSRPDVGLRANLCIPHVADVPDLDSLVENGVLQLRVVPDMHVRPDLGPAPQVSIRSDVRAVANRGMHDR